MRTLRSKLIALGLVESLVPLVVVFLLVVAQQRAAVEVAGEECRRISLENLDSIARDVYTLCATQTEVLQHSVDTGLRVAGDILGREGGASLDPEVTVRWEAVDQFSQERTVVELPRFLAGDTWLGQNTSAATSSLVVDQTRALAGGNTTIFQRMNPAGDLLRVCTSVQKPDGTRAIGTYIPAMNPDGTPNPVSAAVIAGETFRGRAFVVDRWYLTAYEPIRDRAGAVIGALFFGVPLESAEALRQAVMDIRIAETGYVYVLDSKGNYVISAGGKRDGENILEATDSDGHRFIREIVEKAGTVRPGEIFEQRYPWKNQGEEAARMKVARCVYYEPWDWIIGASSYIDEFESAPRHIAAEGRQNLFLLLMVIGLTGAAAAGLGLAASRRIASPVVRAMAMAGRISEGDLSDRIGLRGEDEVGRLAAALDGMADGLGAKARVAEAIADGNLSVDVHVATERDQFGRALRKMCDGLNEILGGIKEAAGSVATGSREIRAASADSARAATEQATALEEMSSATVQLSAQVEMNASSALQADTASRQALSAAHLGAQRVDALNAAMGEISASSQRMAAIIEAIDEIAAQTNLLALNAAIEAARAGEHGRSFAVVADQVRNLAGRSAGAAQETSGLIQESLERIARGIAVAEETSESLGTISGAVEETAGLVARIAAANTEQAAAIGQLRDRLVQVEDLTGRSSAATEEAAASADVLSQQAATLEELLSRFRLRA